MRIKELLEAFVRTRSEKGEVPFKSSAMNDPHIQSVVADLSRRTKVPAQIIIKSMEKYSQEFAALQKTSPKLYDTLVKNIAENAAFNHIQESAKMGSLDLSDVEFEDIDFKMLIKEIEREHPQAMLLLREPGSLKRYSGMKTLLVSSNDPNPGHEYGEIPTAAATPNATFIFNRNFMQQLLYYAKVVDLKPKGEKYEANGGPFPNGYAYIEFLILHELMHFIEGDFSTSRRFDKYDHMAHNWAQDFRINYSLVKSGYEQLPMGLFSDDLNFDRPETPSYDKLIKTVSEELRKINDTQLLDWLEQVTQADVHNDPIIDDDDNDWNDQNDDQNDQNDDQNDQNDDQNDGNGEEIAVGDRVVNSAGKEGIVTKINNDGSVEVQIDAPTAAPHPAINRAPPVVNKQIPPTDNDLDNSDLDDLEDDNDQY